MSASPLVRAHESGALVRPASFATRYDIAGMAADADTDAQRLRLAAAALGVCWPRLRQRFPYNGKPLEYGGRVLDALVAEGEAAGIPGLVMAQEVGELGAAAAALCLEGFVSAKAVEAALGNSGAAAEAAPQAAPGQPGTGG